MHLWNDYEGKTIADTLSLGQLVRPEGRSALFALSNGADAPALVRLTESINDESQMLACWSHVAKVKQENLVAIKRFGETTFEGTPLTYAVMESADANLDDMLKERPLTHAEALQVATSLVPALKALHAQNLVHEHIVAANVLAVGETVKLRTDCVRECVVDQEFTTEADCARLRQQDVHDLALLLLRALTLERELKPSLRLAAPFDQVIRNGLAGIWGLTEMERLLAPPAPAQVVPVVPKQVPAAASAPIPQAAAAQPRAPAPVVPQLDLSFTPAAAAGRQAASDPLHFQRRLHVTNSPAPADRRIPLLAGATIVVVVLGSMLVHFSHSKPTPPASSAAAASQSAPQVVVKHQPSAVAAQATRAADHQAASSPVQAGWYVIAYTFNHAEQAAIRAAAIERKNPSLHPQVIAPSGGSPYLVALGGPMSREQAQALQRRARQSGLPSDTFVRDYKG
jgi:hypothetical protein